MIYIYTEDVDRVFDEAVSIGANVSMSVMDTFWGDRYGQLIDPYAIYGQSQHTNEICLMMKFRE
jgi:uncharacterized glyoxalase superfamily protein PhnB